MRTGARPVITLGLMAGLTALLQTAPLWWPGPGYLLAAAAVLPVALGAAADPRRASWCFAAAVAVTGLVSTQEAVILLCTSGPLGLALGRRAERPWPARALAGAAWLTVGQWAVRPLAGIWPWGGSEAAWSPGWRAAAYAGFALIYAGGWAWAFAQIWLRIAPVVRYTMREEIRTKEL